MFVLCARFQFAPAKKQTFHKTPNIQMPSISNQIVKDHHSGKTGGLQIKSDSYCKGSPSKRPAGLGENSASRYQLVGWIEDFTVSSEAVNRTCNRFPRKAKKVGHRLSTADTLGDFQAIAQRDGQKYSQIQKGLKAHCDLFPEFFLSPVFDRLGPPFQVLSNHHSWGNGVEQLDAWVVRLPRPAAGLR